MLADRNEEFLDECLIAFSLGDCPCIAFCRGSADPRCSRAAVVQLSA